MFAQPSRRTDLLSASGSKDWSFGVRFKGGEQGSAASVTSSVPASPSGRHRSVPLSRQERPPPLTVSAASPRRATKEPEVAKTAPPPQPAERERSRTLTPAGAQRLAQLATPSSRQRRGSSQPPVDREASGDAAINHQFGTSLRTYEQPRADPRWATRSETRTAASSAAAIQKRTREATEAAASSSNTLFAYNNEISWAETPERVQELLDEMRKRAIRPDVVTYNAAISQAERAGHCETAIEWLDEMRRTLGLTTDLSNWRGWRSCFSTAISVRENQLPSRPQQNVTPVAVFVVRRVRRQRSWTALSSCCAK